MTEHYIYLKQNYNTIIAAKAPTLSTEEIRLAQVLHVFFNYKLHAEKRKPFPCIKHCGF